jgi:uncharacterized protein (DUF952 family)
MARLFHIIAEPDWANAQGAGELRPESLQAEGFVHLSYAHQVADTANRFYRERENLLVVEFDPRLIGSAVVNEDSHTTGELFPHVYAAIPVTAAMATHSLTRSPTGDYVFSEGDLPAEDR